MLLLFEFDLVETICLSILILHKMDVYDIDQTRHFLFLLIFYAPRINHCFGLDFSTILG